MKLAKSMNGIIVPTLFVLYVYALLKVILFKFNTIKVTYLWHQLQGGLRNPDYIIERLQSGNLIPFREISRNIHNLSSHDLINLVGNIAVFIPYGIFLLLISKSKSMSFIGVLIRSFCLSLCLECSQLVFGIGTFDVDDLILNTFGGLIGYVAFKFYAKFMVFIQDRDKEKSVTEFNSV